MSAPDRARIVADEAGEATQRDERLTVTRAQFETLTVTNNWERRSVGWILRSDWDGRDILIKRQPPGR